MNLVSPTIQKRIRQRIRRFRHVFVVGLVFAFDSFCACAPA